MMSRKCSSNLPPKITTHPPARGMERPVQPDYHQNMTTDTLYSQPPPVLIEALRAEIGRLYGEDYAERCTIFHRRNYYYVSMPRRIQGGPYTSLEAAEDAMNSAPVGQ